MKPSEKAIEAAWDAYFQLECKGTVPMTDGISAAIEAFIAIDVDPLLAAKDAEIERLLNSLNIRSLENGNKLQRIAELEAELRQQKDECERFHKPA